MLAAFPSSLANKLEVTHRATNGSPRGCMVVYYPVAHYPRAISSFVDLRAYAVHLVVDFF